MPDGLGWGPLSPLGPVPKGTDHRLILPISCTSNLPMQTETQPNPNQVHFFTVTNGKLYGKLNWRITEPDGEFFTRDTVQRFVQDPEKPAILYNHDNEYLHYQASSKMKTRETWGRTIFFFMCMHAHAFLVAWLLNLPIPRFSRPPPPLPFPIRHLPFPLLPPPIPNPPPHSRRISPHRLLTPLPFPCFAGRLVHPGLRAAAVHRRLLPGPQRRMGACPAVLLCMWTYTGKGGGVDARFLPRLSPSFNP